MYKNNRILAVIPARKGSKRFPGKNYRLLNGKPLIEWTINAAKESGFIDEIVVTSDDPKVLEIAKQNRVVDYKRNKELSSDTASSVDVVIDAIESIDTIYDIVLLLQPTSPLRDSSDIVGAINLFIQKKAKSVLSVCEVDHPVQWCNHLDASLVMDNFIKDEFKGLRSQDLVVNYRLNGAIYVWDCKEFITKKEAILKPSFAFIMSKEHSVDIDEEIDFIVAEVCTKSFF